MEALKFSVEESDSYVPVSGFSHVTFNDEVKTFKIVYNKGASLGVKIRNAILSYAGPVLAP
jgi:hypothetical protein